MEEFMMALVDHIRNTTQLRWNRVHKFQTKIQLMIDLGPYIIKTAESRKELIESFKLRDEVFNQEFRGIYDLGLDFDRYDYFSDHLIIVHKESNKIIGTYRMICSKFSSESYTGLEFDISKLRLHEGPYLELGRACIKKEYRKGSVISLLWRGIAEYMNLCGANLLFGCSSLKINDPREAALVYKYLLDAGHISTEFLCLPTKTFTMNDFDSWYSFFRNGLNENQSSEAQGLIPSLLKSYLKLGAKVACEPAFDEDFDCIDMLTILKKENLSIPLAQKFQLVR